MAKDVNNIEMPKIDVTSETICRWELNVITNKVHRYQEEGHTIFAIMHFVAEETKHTVSSFMTENTIVMNVEEAV